MVEGPGCKLKGEKIRSKVLSQSVKTVCGNAVDREQKMLKKQKKDSSGGHSGGDDTAADKDGRRGSGDTITFHRILGHSLEEVLTLGKELFMFFGPSCLRIHFLMAGSFRVNDVHVDTDGGKKIPETASLEIHFSKDKLTFYKCAAEIRPSSACRQKHHNLSHLDICSPSFNPRLAVREMMLEKDRQLCDVLLDQDVLPGVGNIIKNEALFDSGLKPDSKVSELSEEHIAHLVKMTRDFSMLFYKCRKNGTNLRKYMKVYGKGACGECGTKIVMTRMGEDNQRVTYFCPACQTNCLKPHGPLKLPSKNSLLGWVQTEKSVCTKKDWSCQVCTLLNPNSQTNCSVCLNPRSTNHHASTKPSPASKAGSTMFSVTSTVGPPKRTLEGSEQASQIKRVKMDTGQEFSLGQATVGLGKGFSQGQATLGSGKGFSQGQTSVGSGKGFSQGQTTVGLGKKFSPVQHRQLAAARCVQEGGSSESSKIPVCAGHGKTCVMRQTFKDNENKGRWFFTCAASPVGQRCKFFQWADEQFPVCSGHGKVCALRTVMKQGPNNGRRFFSCPLRQKSCQFFQWTTGYG